MFDLHGNPLRKRNETVYGITSLTTSQANPADVLAFNRGHWGIENREHHGRSLGSGPVAEAGFLAFAQLRGW